jgi:hypothetical protein
MTWVQDPASKVVYVSLEGPSDFQYRLNYDEHTDTLTGEKFQDPFVRVEC